MNVGYFIVLFSIVGANEIRLDCIDPQRRLQCVLPQNCELRQWIRKKGCPVGRVCCMKYRSNLYLPVREITSYYPPFVTYGRSLPDPIYSESNERIVFPDDEVLQDNKRVPKSERELEEKYRIINVKQVNDSQQITDKNPKEIEVEDTDNYLFDPEGETKEEFLTYYPEVKTKYKPGERSREYCRNITSDTMDMMQAYPDELPSIFEMQNCPKKFTPLVAGGQETTVKEFPHMAALGYTKSTEIDYLCGGSLISEYFILTAAHCTNTRWGPPILATVGVSNLFSSDAIDLYISDIIPHPKYKSPSTYNDIALLKLEKKMTIFPNARPACLPTYETKAQIPGHIAIATGWGRRGLGRESSATLRSVRLWVITSERCNQYYEADIKNKILKKGIDSTLICAGGLDDIYDDTCQGDSGGPLQSRLPENDCMLQIVGVTSFGKACGTGSPGVYTRIAAFLPWIESVVWP